MKSNVSKSPAWALSTLIGLGHFSSMPGTIGSLVGCLVALVIPQWLMPFLLVLLIVAGVWASGEYEKEKGASDPSEVIVDEVVGVWIAMAGLVVSNETAALALPAFLLFRIFDILKPFPVCTAEKLPRGWGIMADDVVAGVLANLSLRALLWLYFGGLASLM